MKKESRLGPLVRERTKLLAALMRTPDDGLLSFAQANNLSQHVELAQLIRIRDLLDTLGEGLHAEPDAAFWRGLDAALAQLEGSPSSGRAAPAPAPVPPPRVAMPSTPGPPATTDFRHNVMDNKPPLRRAGPPGSRGRNWRPQSGNVRPPAPDQEQTEMVEIGLAGTFKLPASTPTHDWPLKRVVRLEAAYRAYSNNGDPSLEEICAFFGLPDERAIRIALAVWRHRIEEDEELAAEHDELLDTLNQDED